MEYLQYFNFGLQLFLGASRFKPYYKWNTFNTPKDRMVCMTGMKF